VNDDALLLAHAIGLQTFRGIRARREAPHLEFRAIKFNTPWDTYRPSSALEQHRTRAVVHLERALDHWDEVVRITRPIHRDMRLTHYNHNYPLGARQRGGGRRRGDRPCRPEGRMTDQPRPVRGRPLS
jgi:hypothetical protein